jgi:hypothetical protein
MDTKAIDDGGPVYPQSLSPEGPFGGMSLRDYFAGQALPAIIAGWIQTRPGSDETWDGMVARLAYESADAMLLARKGAS